MSNAGARFCYDRLKPYADRLNELIGLIGEGQPPRSEWGLLREKLRELKQDLKNDYKQGSSVRGEAELTEIEKANFFPAIAGALHKTGLSRLKWDSTPGQKWLDIGRSPARGSRALLQLPLGLLHNIRRIGNNVTWSDSDLSTFSGQ